MFLIQANWPPWNKCSWAYSPKTLTKDALTYFMMKPTFLKLEQKQLVSKEIKFELTIKQFQPTIFLQAYILQVLTPQITLLWKFFGLFFFFSNNVNISTLVAISSRSINSFRLCTQIISALKLTFVGVPITSFDPLISPCPFARLHSLSLDIVDIDIKNYSAFMRGAKAPFVCLHGSICSLLVKVVWPTQSTYNPLCCN